MVSALTPHVNETYSREEFEDFQQQCAARGVTVSFMRYTGDNIPDCDILGDS